MTGSRVPIFLGFAIFLCFCNAFFLILWISEPAVDDFGDPFNGTVAPTKMVTSVLAFDRPASLQRCLKSLEKSVYPSNVDFPIRITVDVSAVGSKHWNDLKSLDGRRKTIELVENFHWSHGAKHVQFRMQHVGLARQWFESWNPLPSDDYYISIVEDDLEYSRFYYLFLENAEKNLRISSNPRIAMLCLNDWRTWTKDTQYQLVQLLPEGDTVTYTCSWGAVWKASEWRKFQIWLREHIDRMVPYTTGDFNTWIDEKKDVQSVWVAKYFTETGLKFLNFDLKRTPHDKAALVINHAEPGTNYAVKGYVDTSRLLRRMNSLPTVEEWLLARRIIELT